MAEPTHSDIMGAIKAIEVTLVERRRAADMRRSHLDSTLVDIKQKVDENSSYLKEHGRRLRKVEEVAAFGKGAGWTALKVGTLIAAVLGAAAWLWDRFKSVPH